MSEGALNITPAQAEQFRLRAQALVIERQRKGTWSGGIVAHTDYADKPVEWMVKHLGIPEHTIRWSLNPEYESHKWDGDTDPIVTALEALAASNDVGIESATGVGKTYVAACIVFWFLACFENAIVVTAAPKEEQLLLHIWKEIGELWPRFQRHFPKAELLSGKIRMKPDEGGKEKWAATAFVCGVGANEESATKAQGFHSAHLLIITEETPGINPAIMNAFQNTRTDDHNLHLALGNPDHRNDQLHLFCEDDWVTSIRISAFDHPNIVTGRSVVPGAIGQRRLDERIQRYGKGSRLYQSRIRGISPAEAEDALIRWDWCVAAAERYNDPEFRMGLPAIGGDVANSESGDQGAKARWEGACLTEVEARACPDANIFGREIFAEMSERRIDGRYVGIDSVGVGAGAVNELKRLGMKVRWLSSGTRAIPGLDVDTLWSETETDLEGSLRPSGPSVIEAERFNNLRSQMWWRIREDLRLNRIALPDDEELFQDLTTPTWSTRNGLICVESKEDIVKRLKRSPNKGDAAVYGNFVRRRRPERTKAQSKSNDMRGRRREGNREHGLEMLLSQHQKSQMKERKRMERTLKRMAKRGRT